MCIESLEDESNKLSLTSHNFYHSWVDFFVNFTFTFYESIIDKVWWRLWYYFLILASDFFLFQSINEMHQK